MILKLAKRDIERIVGMSVLVILMLSVIYISIIAVTSAIEIKMKEYMVMEPLMKQNGVFIQSTMIQKKPEDGGTLLRDGKELMDYLPNSKSVVSMESIWEVSIEGISNLITVWCYSKDITDRMKMDMLEGRWFESGDYDSEILKGVVTYNNGHVHAGDVVTMKSNMGDLEYQVEIVGVTDNNQNIFNSNLYRSPYGDYRDFYYPFNFEAEKGMIYLFLSDEQILRGQENGRFEYLNYRINSQKGFQKQMTGPTIVTYDDGISDDIIDKEIDKLQESSFISKIYRLSDMNKNSMKYIFKELYNYLPMFVCVLTFVMIAAISANTIMVKKQMRNYAIYYICGLDWKNCAKISLMVSVITSGVSFVMVIFSIIAINNFGIMRRSAIHIGWIQIISCFIMYVIYVIFSGVIPMRFVKDNSAKDILINNRV